MNAEVEHTPQESHDDMCKMAVGGKIYVNRTRPMMALPTGTIILNIRSGL